MASSAPDPDRGASLPVRQSGAGGEGTRTASLSGTEPSTTPGGLPPSTTIPELTDLDHDLDLIDVHVGHPSECLGESCGQDRPLGVIPERRKVEPRHHGIRATGLPRPRSRSRSCARYQGVASRDHASSTPAGLIFGSTSDTTQFAIGMTAACQRRASPLVQISTELAPLVTPRCGRAREVRRLGWHHAERLAGRVLHDPPALLEPDSSSNELLEPHNLRLDVVGLDVEVCPSMAVDRLHEHLAPLDPADRRIRSIALAAAGPASHACPEVTRCGEQALRAIDPADAVLTSPPALRRRGGGARRRHAA